MIAISDVAVTVSDANAAAQWWREKLGFETHTIGGPEGHAVMVAPPGERFLIHLCEGIETVDPGNTGSGSLRTSWTLSCIGCRKPGSTSLSLSERKRGEGGPNSGTRTATCSGSWGLHWTLFGRRPTDGRVASNGHGED